MRSSLRPVLFVLNGLCLACYGACLLVFASPLWGVFERQVFGYGGLLAALLALGAAGCLQVAIWVVSLLVLRQERSFFWGLLLSLCSCVLVPVALGGWVWLAS